MAKVFFAGRIVRDCELKVTKSGENMYVFDVAENYKGGTTFYKVMIKQWFERIASHMTKGKAVAVSGSLSASVYTGKDGKPKIGLTVFADDVQFMSSRTEDAQGNLGQTNDGYSDAGFVPVTDDDLPF